MRQPILFLLLAGCASAVSVTKVECDADADGFPRADCPTDDDSPADCDDTRDAVHPGATEACNAIDDDCDGTVDGPDASDATTWYADLDGDAWGDPEAAVRACAAPPATVSLSGDCADADPAVHPGAAEVACDGLDNDCDATSTDRWDADGDGVDVCSDCDDATSAVHPGATEACNAIDDDCDGAIDESGGTTWYADTDGDGYGGASTVTACTAPSGYTGTSTDCDDADPAVHPGTTEACNGTDDDCDGLLDDADTITAATPGVSLFYADADGDGYGDPAAATHRYACVRPGGFVTNADDCDDATATVHPDATEACNSIDDDCDGLIDDADSVTATTPGVSLFYADADGDGYGDPAAATHRYACVRPAGFVTNADDCDDAASAVHPGAAEACDGIDSDCDGGLDEVDACDCVSVIMGHEYAFCGTPTAWADGETVCTDLGMHLVTVDGSEENTSLLDEADALGWVSRSDDSRDAGPWTGCNDRTVEGSFVNVATSAAVTYANWASGEPNDGNSSTTEDCAYIIGGRSLAYQWNDYACENLLPFVCE